MFADGNTGNATNTYCYGIVLTGRSPHSALEPSCNIASGVDANTNIIHNITNNTNTHHHQRETAESFDFIFCLCFTIVTWNVRSIWANDCSETWDEALKLISSHDITVLTETHATPERIASLMSYFNGDYLNWHTGNNTHTEGVSIFIKRAWTLQFRYIRHKVLVLGRILKVTFIGKSGTINIYGAYFNADSSANRIILIRALYNDLDTRHRNIFIGDFNFCFAEGDKINNRGEIADVDHTSARTWNNTFGNNMTEIPQEEYTCRHSFGLSKVDMVFDNLKVADLHLLQVSCNTLNFKPGISDHCPVSVSYGIPGKPLGKVPDWVCEIEGFDDEVFQFWGRSTVLLEENPFEAIMDLKNAITRAAKYFVNENKNIDPKYTQQKLGICAGYIRAIHRCDYVSAIRLRSSYTFLNNNTNSGRPENPQLECVKNHFVDLVQLADREKQLEEQKRNEMMEQRNLTDNFSEPKTHSVFQTLYNFGANKGGGIAAIADHNGNVITGSEGKAKVLLEHWQPTFTDKAVPDADDSSFINAIKDVHLCQDAEVMPTEEDVIAAIDISPNSACGPDGIPYRAYRKLKNITVILVLMIIRCLADGLHEVCGDFNEAIMVFLPKEPSGKFEGLPFFGANATRPLSLANTFTKLVTTACRLSLERCVAHKIIYIQRGFIRGRQILSNVVEMDCQSRIAATRGNHPAMIFFDFLAAFPSVSHAFLFKILEAAGIPKRFINIIKKLYTDCRHQIRIDGKLYPGPLLLGGVRQGCPLSGILFALVVDPFLRCLDAILKGDDLARAYADDIGIILCNWILTLPGIISLFTDFAKCAGLQLNLAKTIFIPLWAKFDITTIRQQMQLHIPEWATMPIAANGKYLGFYLGPGGFDATWKMVYKKMNAAVCKWAAIHPGALYTILACNVYILSKMSYILQCYELPDDFHLFLTRLIAQLFPGPGMWITWKYLCGLKELGFPAQILNPFFLAKATMRRQIWRLQDISSDTIVSCKLTERASRNINTRDDTDFIWWIHNGIGTFWGNNINECNKYGINNIFISQGMEKMKGSKRSPQKLILERIQLKLQYTGYVNNFLRNRLKYWDIYEPLRRVTDRTARHIALAGKLTKPAVTFAYLRTCMNGWPTFQRMHHCSSFTGTDLCIYGCNCGNDSLKHYGHCRIVKSAFEKVFPGKLWSGGMEHRLCLVHTYSDHDLRDSFRFVYAMYRTFNLIRHSSSNSEHLDVTALLVEFYKQSRWRRS